MAIFDHKVNHNGIMYLAGQNVPIEEDDVNGGLPFVEVPDRITEDNLRKMSAKEIKTLASDKGLELSKTKKDEIIKEFLEKQ